MKKTLPGILSIVFFFLIAPIANAQQVFKISPATSIGYLEYLPPDYHSNSNKYPVVIFLHGIGERGPNSTDPATLESGATLLAKLGPPKHAKNGFQFPFILISPQLKSNYGNWPTWYVMEIINHVKNTLRIDERRIHITGLSLGGGGAWTMAQEYPKLFATVSPICGGYNAPSKACNIAAENLPVWAFHGDADPTVSLSKSVNMVKAINACTPAPNPLAKLSIYPGVKHNAWDRAYAPDHTYHNPNVYEWIMSFTNTTNAKNKIPVVNAGSDKVSTAKSYTLTSSASDADGSIAGYQWKKIGGPACTMNNATSASLSLSGLTPGSYMFKVTAKDNVGDTDTDYVKLTIHNAPTANAGADASITLPTSSITLTGSGSDPDGTIASYKWIYISGPKVPTLTNSTSKSVTVSSLTAAGDYILELQVKDNLGAIGKDQVKVTVKDATSSPVSNAAPVANAGKDLSITLPTSSVSITGSGTDSDGTIASYRWTFVSGPKVPSLTNTTSTKVSVSGLSTAGTYTFQLEVKDNAGAIGKDHVLVSVLNAPTTANIAPVANAGKDITIYLPTNSVTISGSGTDADGTIVSYSWVQAAGPIKASLSGASTSKLAVSGMTVDGFYVFKLRVTDNSGAYADDKVGVAVKNLSATATAYGKMDLNAEPVSPEESVDLSDDSNQYWKDKHVVVYNETGARIFAGSWLENSYQAVFQKGGFYLYSIASGSKRISSGKIVITR